jgi:hypothetical protein
MNTTHAQVGAGFIRSGFGLFIFGLVMSFGIVGHYIVGARYPTGEVFLQNISLWYACPWTLSTAVVLIGAVGMIAIGSTYVILGRAVPQGQVVGLESTARAICFWALIAIFLTGYAGYFVFDRIWVGFYYVPIKEGKNAWLLLQLACMVAYMVGVILASGGVKRLIRAAV